MKREKKMMKKGAASFYVVAFSTLILMIIATSFAAIIISEVTRTTNDDLSQSAYDSAMAGVEDAKLAYYNYQNCMVQKNNGSLTEGSSLGEKCEEIFSSMNKKKDELDCDMVARMIGRSDKGVVIEESNTVGNNMQQSYTCVTMTDTTEGYSSTLSQSDLIRVVKAKFEDGTPAKKIGAVRLSWYSDQDVMNSGKNFNNYPDCGSNKVVFPTTISKPVSTPPTLSLAMVQTAQKFTMSDFDVTKNGNTDRAMVYLVPTKSGSNGSDYNHIAAEQEHGQYKNYISAAQFAKSNDKVNDTNNKRSANLPFTVKCNDDDADYLCSAVIALPDPVNNQPDPENGERNDDTFIFVVGLPYGKPSTEFLLEFLCKDGEVCKSCPANGECTDIASGGAVNLKGVQVEVDSTGKANDLYRRVSVTLDNKQDYSLSLLGPLELLNDGGNESLNKDFGGVICEYNFGVTCQ